MAVTAAQLAVKVSAEGISQTQSALGGLSDRVKSVTGHVGGFVGGLLDVGSKLGMTIFGVQNLAQTIGGLGQALLGSNATLEQQKVAFTGLLGSAQKADAFLRQMQQFAAATPFEFPDLVTASQRLLAMGFNAKQIQPMLTSIGDAMAGMGAGKEQLDAIVVAFGQMHAAGKVHLQDLMQITNTGVPALKLLADGFHVSTAKMQEMISSGSVPADKAIRILQKGMEKLYGGQMKNQATTFNGLVSTLADNARLALTAFAGPLFERAKGALGKLGDLVQSPAFQQFAKTIGEKVGGALDKVLPLFGGLFDTFTKFQEPLSRVTGAYQELTNSVGPILGKVDIANKTVLVKHAGLLSQIGTFIGGTLVPAFQKFGSFFVANILPALLKFGTFIQTTVLPALGQFAGFIVDKVVPAILNLAAWASKNLLPVIQTLAGVFVNDVLPAVEGIWTSIQENLIPAIQHLWEKISPILMPVLQLLGWILSHVVGPALGLVINIIGHLIDIIATIIGKIGDFLGWLGTLKDKGIDRLKTGFQLLGQTVSGIWDGIKTSVKNGVNVVIGLINGLIDHINSIQIHIPKVDLPGGGSIGGNTISFPQIPHIPLLARGGYLTAGGSVLVGERGPELLSLPSGAAVRPLSQAPGGSGGGGFGGTITFMPGSVVINGAASGQQVWEQMKDAMRREGMKHNGR